MLIYKVHEYFIYCIVILTGLIATMTFDWSIENGDWTNIKGLVIHKEYVTAMLVMLLIVSLLLIYKKKTKAYIKSKFDV